MTVPDARRSLEEQFDLFCSANTFESVVVRFNELCSLAVTVSTRHPWTIYTQLNARLKSYWKAAALFEKLEKRIRRPEYMHQTACSGLNVLVVGCGPCGLRCAIELALLGARVVIVEKRDTFSRNNVLHLWPYLIEDLRALGAKTFFGKFCAGSIDHISIRTLQCILLKVALLFGVQVFAGFTYRGLIEPIKGSTLGHGLSVNRVFLEHESTVCLPNGDSASCYPHSIKSPPVSINPPSGVDGIGNSGSDNTASNGFLCGKQPHAWRVSIEPSSSVLNQYDVDVLIGADGKRSCLGFPSKELRCRLALAITVNFVNYHTPAETQVEEISGVSSIFNQQFFARLAADTGIDLENIVYYKDETHYFVMTAKKHSLLAKGVLRQDREDSNSLLNPDNVDKQALQAYARETAQYVTNGQLSQLDFALNARGEPDVEVFDFTRMFAAEYSCRIVERNGHLLMQCLIGDGLFEPFWPTGSGCALGFLSALDAAWAVSRLASGSHPLQVIMQRESVYQRLSQTTAQNMPSNFSEYTLDPRTRYVRCDLNLFTPAQVRHLYCTDTSKTQKVTRSWRQEINNLMKSGSNSLRDQLIAARSVDNDPDNCQAPGCNLALLRWFQFRLAFYASFDLIEPITDLVPAEWESGTNLLCLIHLYRPDLVPELEQFFANPDAKPDHREILNRYATSPAPKPSLIRACGLLIEHFNVEFVTDMNGGTSTYPRSLEDWQMYLGLVRRTLGQLPLIGLCSVSVASKLGQSLTRTQSLLTTSNLNKSPNKMNFNKDTTPRSRPLLEKRIDALQSNGRVKVSLREDPNWLVEKGLLLKRRAELIATLQDPASTKRRSPIPPHLLLPNNKHIKSSSSLVFSRADMNSSANGPGKTNGVISSKELHPSAIKPITVPETVARLFAPRKGSVHCYVCDKRLYLIERLMAFGLFFHRHCFRCSECGCQLQSDKATCIRSSAPDQRDKFLCPAHSQVDQSTAMVTGKSSTKHPVTSHTGVVSLEARLQARQFPFGPPNRTSPVQQDVPSHPLSMANHPSLADFIPHSRPPTTGQTSSPYSTRFGRSALLAGLQCKDDVEEIMGIVNVPNLIHHFRHSGLRTTDSSSTTSPERQPSSRSQHPTGPTGDHAPEAGRARPNGIRDDPAPGPDCYLAGHLGLPEVERRANWELNRSSAWPGASIPDILEHMKINRLNLFSLEDYFASGESEQVSTDTEEPSVISFNLIEKISSERSEDIKSARYRYLSAARRKRRSRVRPHVPSSHTTTVTATLASVSSTVNLNQATVDTLPASQTLLHTAGSANSSLLSSPAHQVSVSQSRLAAKQKFCLEPPKPFTIDPKQFVSSRNRDRCVTTELSDCSEQLESIEDLDIQCASVVSVHPLPVSSTCLHPVQVRNDSHSPLTDPSRREYVKTTPRSDEEHMKDVSHFSTVNSLSDWQESNAAQSPAISEAPYAALDEFRDIDSMSTVTERSSTEHRTDSDYRSRAIEAQTEHKKGVMPITSRIPRGSNPTSQLPLEYGCLFGIRDTSSTSPLSQYPIATHAKHPYAPCLPRPDTERSRRVRSEDRLTRFVPPNLRARSAQSELDETDTSEDTTSSADLDSAVSIRPLPGTSGNPLQKGILAYSRLELSHLGSTPNQESVPVTSRDVNHNQQALELTRELESLETTMRRLERAGVQTERELYSIDPPNGNSCSDFPLRSNNYPSGAQLFLHRDGIQGRARTLNYDVTHSAIRPSDTSLHPNSPQSHGASSDRRYQLLKRLAALLTTKSMLLEYASNLTDRRDELQRTNIPVCEDQNDLATGYRISRASTLSRCLSDPNLSLLQLDRLAQLQTTQSIR